MTDRIEWENGAATPLEICRVCGDLIKPVRKRWAHVTRPPSGVPWTHEARPVKQVANCGPMV